MKNRKMYIDTWQELADDKNMIFLAGPRQSGKTTLGDIIAENFPNHLYFNWDIPTHRERLINNPSFFVEVERVDSSLPFIHLDEIHKYKDWKNYLKGAYDEFKKDFKFLISGSGRLDVYQKGSDSLAGRYFLFHLWPFTIAELGNSRSSIESFKKNPLKINIKGKKGLQQIWNDLSILSGFPEPYLSCKETTYRRWSSTYSRQLIREDIRDLSGVKSINDIETLYALLPSRIGSPLSLTSLSRDLKVSYNSIRLWLSIFETFFLIFSITPWTKKISRAIQKERKIYIWDTPLIKDPAARFENMIALELFRAVNSWNDNGLGRFDLHFIKNKEKQEVDFLISDNNAPFLLVEAKLSEMHPSKSLQKFQNMLDIPGIQLVNTADTFKIFNNANNQILVAPASQWLSRLP